MITASVEKFGPCYRIALREGLITYLMKNYTEEAFCCGASVAQDQLVIEADDKDLFQCSAFCKRGSTLDMRHGLSRSDVKE